MFEISVPRTTELQLKKTIKTGFFSLKKMPECSKISETNPFKVEEKLQRANIAIIEV